MTAPISGNTIAAPTRAAKNSSGIKMRKISLDIRKLLYYR
jgi:hypothetical protein